MSEMMQHFGASPDGDTEGVMKQFSAPKRGKKGASVAEQVQLFMTQQANRPEATRDVNERLVQAMAELGRLAHGYFWRESPQQLNKHWAQLFILLYGTCVQQNIDVERIVADQLVRLPTQPAPSRQRARARGLRL